MDWVNLVMTITGWVLWGIIAAAIIIYGVITVMYKVKELVRRRKDDTEKSFYYDHDYTSPVAVVRIGGDDDGSRFVP